MPEERFSISRALIVGSILCCAIPLMAHLSVDIVHASYMAIDFMPVAAVFVFFVLVFLLNTLIRAVSRDAALTRPELLVVYTMLIVCSSITTMGLGSQLLPIMGAPNQFATPENRWAEIIQPHVPQWLAPSAEAARTGSKRIRKTNACAHAPSSRYRSRRPRALRDAIKPVL